MNDSSNTVVVTFTREDAKKRVATLRSRNKRHALLFPWQHRELNALTQALSTQSPEEGPSESQELATELATELAEERTLHQASLRVREEVAEGLEALAPFDHREGCLWDCSRPATCTCGLHRELKALIDRLSPPKESG